MLQGWNVSMRPVTAEDSPLLENWLGDRDYVGEFLDVWTVTREEWARRLSAGAPGPDAGVYVALERSTGEPVGLTGYFNPFTRPELFKALELWGQVHPRFRKRGIAVEGSRLLINHLFKTFPIERIQATVSVGNTASCRVAEAMGMQEEGVCRRLTLLHGNYVDMYLYSIVRSDWQNEEAYLKRRPSIRPPA